MKTHLMTLALAALAVLGTSPALAGTIGGEVVRKDGRKVSNAVVYIKKAPGKSTPPAEHAVLDQKNKFFTPHVLPITAGTTVDFRNSDEVKHNVFSPDGDYDMGTWPPGTNVPRRFDKAGVYTQLCNIHTEMMAFIVVLDSPYFARTNEQGKFEIAGVPDGGYTLETWHKKRKFPPVKVEVKGGTAGNVVITSKEAASRTDEK